MNPVIAANWIERAESLQKRLMNFHGPAYRKTYLAHLLSSGSRLSAEGEHRSGAYCFDKVDLALQGIGIEVAQTESSPTAESIEAARAKASPLERLRHQWRKDRLLDAEVVLRRQGRRLSTLENQIYREKLEKLRAAGEKAITSLQSNRIDASILDLRGQLYKRVLKSQKISLRPAHHPAEALQKILLLPDTKSKADQANPTKNNATSIQSTIIGPYNDRYNLGDFLTLLSQADAAWVEEFLELYRDLRDLKGLVSVERA